MNHLPVPSDGHACCTSLKKYIEAAERDADATQAAAKKFAERSVAYAAALDEFKVRCGWHLTACASAAGCGELGPWWP